MADGVYGHEDEGVGDVHDHVVVVGVDVDDARRVVDDFDADYDVDALLLQRPRK